jgi:TnpA family transposase
MKLATILSKSEEKAFNSLPSFTIEEQKHFFRLPKILSDKCISYEDNSRSFFTIMFGCFKATNRFFSISEYISHDYSYFSRELLVISKSRVYHYQNIIKEYFSIREYSKDIQEQLQQESDSLASNYISRKKIFYSLVNYSKRLNIETPSYHELSKIITTSLRKQKSDILTSLKSYIDDESISKLDEFLKKDTNYKNRYNLALYKKLEHSTKKNQMVLSLSKFDTIKKHFKLNQSIIDSIGITSKIAEYNATWIGKSDVYELHRKDNTETIFLLLCFVYHQYLVRTDNLIDRFITTVQSAKTSISRQQKELSYQLEPKKSHIIKSLEKSNSDILHEISLVLKNSSLSSNEKLDSINKLINDQSEILDEIMAQKSELEKSKATKYDFIEGKSISLQGRLSGILKSVEFDEVASNRNLISAINYFKDHTTITNKAPKEFLSEEEQIIIFDGDRIRVSLYKALLFLSISDAIKNGTLSLVYSYKYKTLDNYMIPSNEWVKNRDTLLKKHELEHLNSYHNYIENIKVKVANSYKTTNTKILKDLNPHFTSSETSFILKTPKVDKSEDIDSISKYLPSSEHLSVIDILSSTDQEVDFLSSFKHYNSDKECKNRSLLLASILGFGCNLNISKLGQVSKGITEYQLDNTKSFYFSVDSTIEANDKIIQYLDNLEIIKTVRNTQQINHTSSDGQKYNISSSIDSTNAGYSFKYFGTDKGVVAYTFIDESHRLFHSQVINVNERESGYVIDGLLHNETVKSDIHSTDTHGFSEIIFGLTNLLGYSFAPRIKNFKEQQLYSFVNKKLYQNLGYKLLPRRKLNEKVIIENWDDILRFIITIKERKTTATQLLKRLSSYSRQHKLYQALKEFGRIIKTDFLLGYVDDVDLRQRIEKQLNKIESSNKFSKAVFFGNNAELQVSTVDEQNIANNCKRLIQNSIILWNYLYITKKIQQAPNQETRDDIIKSLKNSSIVHWSHINFHGEYDFTKSSKRVYNLIALKDTKIST